MQLFNQFMILWSVSFLQIVYFYACLMEYVIYVWLIFWEGGIIWLFPFKLYVM